MSTPVHQWLQNHSIFDDMQHHYQQFSVDQLASCDQHQHQHQAQSLQTYSAYSQILDDCDKALLATIYLGPSSTDRAFTTSVTATDVSANMAASMDHMPMYEIPALPPGMEGCHTKATWEPKHPMGHSSPLVRSMTVFPEVASSHNNNGQSNENSLVLSPYVSDNHALHNNNNFCGTTTATNNSLAVNITLPDQGTPPPPPSMTQCSPHQPQQQQQQYHHHHHHQYGAVDSVSAAFLHLSHPYHPFSFSPSVSPPPFSGSPSPSNTLFPSIYPPTSPSLSSPSVCSSPYGSSMPATPGGPNHSHHSLFATGSEQHMSHPSWPLSGSSPSSRSLDSRSTPIMTRRRSRVFLEKQAMLSSSPSSSASPSPGTMRHLLPIMTRRRSQALAQNALLVAAVSMKTMTTAVSFPSITKPKPLPFARLPTSKISSNTGGGAYSTAATTSPILLLNPSGATPSSPKALICPICKKDYANNSTLRRHLKIHAYNSTSTATRKVCTPPPPPSGANVSTTGGHNSVLSSIPGSATSNHLDVTAMSPTLAAVNTHLISSFWPYRDIPASSPIRNSETPMSHIHLQSHIAAAAAAAVGGVVTPGYNPGSDPTIKKPECVGCSKPFARRDTVILHIKNQKRKWDLLCAMLPALSTSISGNSGNTDQSVGGGAAIDGDDDEDGDGGDDDDDDDEVTTMDSNGRRQIQSHTRQRRTSSLTKAATGSKLVGPAHRRYVRQRRAHPFRDVEKLWQSTLQRKKIHFGAYKKPVSSSTTAVSATASTQRLGVHKSGQFIYEGDGEYDGEYDGEELANYAQQQQKQQQQKRGGGVMDVDMMSALMEDKNDDEDEEREDEDGWPSQEVLDGMDNQTKIHWMVKMAVEPPCWSERKVRLFGAYGMVEETVLQ